MFCSKCGFKNKDGALFCEECGAKLRVKSVLEEKEKQHLMLSLMKLIMKKSQRCIQEILLCKKCLQMIQVLV